MRTNDMHDNQFGRISNTDEVELLETKLTMRDKLIQRLNNKIAALEAALEEGDSLSRPPEALREAFANLTFDD